MALNNFDVQPRCGLCRRTVKWKELLRFHFPTYCLDWSHSYGALLIAYFVDFFYNFASAFACLFHNPVQVVNLESYILDALNLKWLTIIGSHKLPSPWRFIWRPISSLLGSSGDSKTKIILFCLIACATVLENHLENYEQHTTFDFQFLDLDKQKGESQNWRSTNVLLA